MAVRVLPDHVINQISAGEVIDRPSSVVRELVDNSIDANADDIAIYLEQGGRALIKVSDNGIGMSHDDAVLAFERHATSKLFNAEDLTKVETLGFRGEALPSIASVSRVALRTQQNGSTAGVEVVIDGGVLKSVRAQASGVGTEIEVEKLFFNTPARRKFLKEPRTEETKVKQWIRQIAYAHPHIRFRIHSEGKEVLNIPRRSNFFERAKSMVRGTTVDINGGDKRIYIEGIIAHPSQAKSDINGLVLIVNRRVVADRMLLRAVREGFDSTLKDREFPVGVLALTVDPVTVDVNVHPQKSEVRFRNSQEVFLAVRSMVLKAVRDFRTPLQSNILPGSIVRELPKLYQTDRASVTFNQSIQGSLAIDNSVISSAPLNSAPDFKRAEPFSYTSLQYLAQVFECFLLFMGQDGYFYAMDMHAAHERCNYNLFRSKFLKDKIHSQNLLVPLTIELDEEQAQLILGKSEIFSQYGMEIEEFGANGVLVRSAPPAFDSASIIKLINQILMLDHESDVSGTFEERFDHVVARLACHASIRSGYRMQPEEVGSLLAALDQSELSSACPHGRPITVRFAREDLERWFGRDR